MKAPIARCMLLLLILSACTAAPRSIHISDNDFVEESRQYSPDRAMLILNYKLDIGALGLCLAKTRFTCIFNNFARHSPNYCFLDQNSHLGLSVPKIPSWR